VNKPETFHFGNREKHKTVLIQFISLTCGVRSHPILSCLLLLSNHETTQNIIVIDNPPLILLLPPRPAQDQSNVPSLQCTNTGTALPPSSCGDINRAIRSAPFNTIITFCNHLMCVYHHFTRQQQQQQQQQQQHTVTDLHCPKSAHHQLQRSRPQAVACTQKNSCFLKKDEV
jgi:hypothetical protein